MGKREERQRTIRNLVRRERIRTQRDLAERLKELQYECTQATVSRDITEMGLLKSGQGYYALPEDMILERVLNDMVLTIEDAGNLLVVKTSSGGAAVLGEAIDNTDIEGLVGSVAGDNTILIVAKTPEYAKKIGNMFKNMRK
ncbi:MAG: arginine repressor [Eggerthellaceae bacterium]|jgi:transcriptional regulator of arginine metabolism